MNPRPTPSSGHIRNQNISIHFSARFDGLENLYHGNFEVSATQQQIEAQKQHVTNIAVGKLREKCINEWKIDFETLNKIEVYFYSRIQPREILVFSKEKGR